MVDLLALKLMILINKWSNLMPWMFFLGGGGCASTTSFVVRMQDVDEAVDMEVAGDL